MLWRLYTVACKLQHVRCSSHIRSTCTLSKVGARCFFEQILQSSASVSSVHGHVPRAHRDERHRWWKIHLEK